MVKKMLKRKQEGKAGYTAIKLYVCGVVWYSICLFDTYLGWGDCDMSRRRNGTNRAAALINASRYTGYAKPNKKAVSLAELNDRIKNNIQDYYNQNIGGNQDE